MIKINLASSASSGLGVGSPTSSSGGGDVFLGENELRKEAIKRFAVILIPAAALFAYQQQNVPAKEAELASKNQVLQELQSYNAKQAASVAEIKKFKEDEAMIEARIGALAKIAKDRYREIRVMDLLQSVIPEKAWLTRVQINPDKLLIQGMALSDYEVSGFLEALTKSVFLMDVNLVNSTEVSVDGSNLKKFEISGLLEKPR